METFQLYTHLPFSSIERMLEFALSVQDYKKASDLKKAIEHIIINSTIEFTKDGMKLIPTFEEMVEYIIAEKVVLKESVKGTTLDQVKMTKALLAYENGVKTDEVRVQLNLRRL